MTLDQKIVDEIEAKVPWIPHYLEDYDNDLISQDLCRSQLTYAYGIVSEKTYLALLHMYNGVEQARQFE